MNAIFDTIIAMRVNVLALDDVFDLGLSAVLDAFQTANELIVMAKMTVPRFEVRTVGLRKTVKTSHGLRVPLHAVDGGSPDCVVVPAIGFKMPGPLEAALTRPDVRDAAAVLRHWAGRGATMSAACIGTFVMAESGLLDHEHATTTWWLAPLFRERYPDVQLDESHMIVQSGRFVTAGAALSHMDLALWVVRSVEGWARSRLTRGFSLGEAARAVGSSKRTLARRMQDVLGKSPLSYFQTLRVECAVHLLKTSSASIDEIAERVGYSEGSILRG